MHSKRGNTVYNIVMASARTYNYYWCGPCKVKNGMQFFNHLNRQYYLKLMSEKDYHFEFMVYQLGKGEIYRSLQYLSAKYKNVNIFYMNLIQFINCHYWLLQLYLRTCAHKNNKKMFQIVNKQM